jgi:hypothetical protein
VELAEFLKEDSCSTAEIGLGKAVTYSFQQMETTGKVEQWEIQATGLNSREGQILPPIKSKGLGFDQSAMAVLRDAVLEESRTSTTLRDAFNIAQNSMSSLYP